VQAVVELEQAHAPDQDSLGTKLKLRTRFAGCVAKSLSPKPSGG